MRYLLILDAALFALAATLAMVLGVVWILLSFHTELSARIGSDMQTVATVVGLFTLIAGVQWLAFWTLWRDLQWRWWAQAGAALGTGLLSLALYGALTS